jgi:hypothetical protein
MESHPCKKHRGVGSRTLTPASSLEPPASPAKGDESLRDEESRKRPVRVIWDMPCPPYERADAPESTGS